MATPRPWAASPATAKHPQTRKRRLTRKQLALCIASGDTSLLELCDQRFQVVRRLRDIVEDFYIDMGGSQLTAGELALIRRAAFLTLQLELIESGWAGAQTGKRDAMPLTNTRFKIYSAATSALRRVLLALSTLAGNREPRRPGDPLPLHPGQRLTLAEMQAQLNARGIPTRFDPPLVLPPHPPIPSTRQINGAINGKAIH